MRHSVIDITKRKHIEQLPLPGSPALKPELVSVPRSKTSSSLVCTCHTVFPFQLLSAVRPHEPLSTQCSHSSPNTSPLANSLSFLESIPL